MFWEYMGICSSIWIGWEACFEVICRNFGGEFARVLWEFIESYLLKCIGKIYRFLA